MRDEDIFKKLKKETPLIKQKDLSPLSSKDFTPKRSSFDVLMEKTNDKRAERQATGYRARPVSYPKPDARQGDRGQAAKQSELSLYDDERVQRPRTIQARSETRIRGEAEPVRRPVTPQPYNRPEQERTPHMEIRSTAAPVQKQAVEPERAERTARAVMPQTQKPLKEPEARMEISRPARTPQSPAQEYKEPPKRRMAAMREAYSSADAAELEIFSEAAPKRRSTVRTDTPVLAPMRQQRTEFEEYYEPAEETEEKPAFRHELKYYINYTEYILLRNTLKALAQLDKYAGENGEYYIRSLYFDDEYESALMDKMGGNDFRKKFRIRIYNFSDDVIKFEKKMKQGQFVTKKTISLSREEYDSILAGEYAFLLRRKEPLASELYLELTNNRLRPRVIVDYVREAYVYPFENIRITFDKDLRSGMWLSDIFDPKAPTMPMYDEGTMVLEVKFEKSLPAHIRGVLGNIQAAQRSAISKYVICRKFE